MMMKRFANSHNKTLRAPMTHIHTLTAGLAALVLSAGTLFAQTPAPAIGVHGAYQLVSHDAQFQGIPNVPCCAPMFEDGTGGGGIAGLFYRHALSRRAALQLRTGFSTMGGTLTTRENIGNRVENGNVVDVFSDHTVTSSFSLLSLQPMFSWTPFSFPLGIDLGAELAFAMKSDYEQRETLVGDGEFTTGAGNVRNESAGEIPDHNAMQVAGVAGLSYDIPLGGKLTLAPEVSYRYAFTDVAQNIDWKTHALRLGASLRFSLGSEDIPTGPAGLFASVHGVGVDAGVERPLVQMRVEEFLATEFRPLLSYIFFDKGSAVLDRRYNRLSAAQREAFSVDDLYARSTLGIYHHVLNIIGKRMVDNPKARIRLIGCTSGEPGERGNQDLASLRAEMVRDYLRDTWGIDASRMTIQPRGMPEEPSNEADPDGAAENRRVEIVSDTWSILEPVQTSDTAREVTPSRIRFRTVIDADEPIVSWRLEAAQSAKSLRVFEGSGDPPETAEWDVEGERKSIPLGTGTLDFSLKVTDATGREFTTPVSSLPVDQVTVQKKRFERIADKEIARYSLILFGFASASLDENNRRIIDLIRSRIAPGATVTITGSTDRIGDDAFNEELSRERAKEVAQALNIPGADVRSIGEAPHLHDNDLPEGRFYCRTVSVVVETPIR